MCFADLPWTGQKTLNWKKERTKGRKKGRKKKRKIDRKKVRIKERNIFFRWLCPMSAWCQYWSKNRSSLSFLIFPLPVSFFCSFLFSLSFVRFYFLFLLFVCSFSFFCLFLFSVFLFFCWLPFSFFLDSQPRELRSLRKSITHSSLLSVLDNGDEAEEKKSRKCWQKWPLLKQRHIQLQRSLMISFLSWIVKGTTNMLERRLSKFSRKFWKKIFRKFLGTFEKKSAWVWEVLLALC